MTDDDRKALLTALTTEHFVLQTASNGTLSETSAPASLYVVTLSSALIAMGFVADSRAFLPFVATVLPGVFLLGVLTVFRLVDAALGNREAIRGRHILMDRQPLNDRNELTVRPGSWGTETRVSCPVPGKDANRGLGVYRGRIALGATLPHHGGPRLTNSSSMHQYL